MVNESAPTWGRGRLPNSCDSLDTVTAPLLASKKSAQNTGMLKRVIALFIASLMVAEAQPASGPVPWDRTPEVLAGRWVMVELNDGTSIQGSWAAVTSQTFRMVVEKTSQKRQVAKGLQELPRSEVRRIRYSKRRVRGRVIGTIAGFYGALTLAAAATPPEDGLQGAWSLAAIAGAVLGYQLGKSLDKDTHELLIAP